MINYKDDETNMSIDYQLTIFCLHGIVIWMLTTEGEFKLVEQSVSLTIATYQI